MKMRFEIVNRNEPGFQHFILTPAIEIISEVQGEFVEYSIGFTWFNISLWVVIVH